MAERSMNPDAGESREKILEIKDLCMEFPSGRKQTVKALNHVTFDIYKGENFGLVGDSGCGKTTLGRTVIRLYDPTSGDILFNCKSISGIALQNKCSASVVFYKSLKDFCF